MSKIEIEILETLEAYLEQCKVDDLDRWITRETLHTLMKRRRAEVLNE